MSKNIYAALVLVIALQSAAASAARICGEVRIVSGTYKMNVPNLIIPEPGYFDIYVLSDKSAGETLKKITDKSSPCVEGSHGESTADGERTFIVERLILPSVVKQESIKVDGEKAQGIWNALKSVITTLGYGCASGKKSNTLSSDNIKCARKRSSSSEYVTTCSLIDDHKSKEITDAVLAQSMYEAFEKAGVLPQKTLQGTIILVAKLGCISKSAEVNSCDDTIDADADQCHLFF